MNCLETSTWKFNYTRNDGILDIQLEGRIDVLHSPEFLAELDAVITSDDAAVMLNMRRLEYINSAGMRALLELVRKLRNQDAKLAIYSPIGPVREVFQLSGFNRVMAIHTTREEAVAAVTE